MTHLKTPRESREAKIEATAEIGKSISVKVEKSDDDEVTRCHLKIKDLLVNRETADLLIGWQPGRADLALYDETGEPREKLVLSSAVLKGVQLDLCPLGAKLSGELVWGAAGDEVSDIEPLLGKLCVVRLVVRGQQQIDLFQGAA